MTKYGFISHLEAYIKQLLNDPSTANVDDFLKKIQWEYLNGCEIEQSEIEFLIYVSSQIAEQLKAGVKNE